MLTISLDDALVDRIRAVLPISGHDDVQSFVIAALNDGISRLTETAIF